MPEIYLIADYEQNRKDKHGEYIFLAKNEIQAVYGLKSLLERHHCSVTAITVVYGANNIDELQHIAEHGVKGTGKIISVWAFKELKYKKPVKQTKVINKAKRNPEKINLCACRLHKKGRTKIKHLSFASILA